MLLEHGALIQVLAVAVEEESCVQLEDFPLDLAHLFDRVPIQHDFALLLDLRQDQLRVEDVELIEALDALNQ